MHMNQNGQMPVDMQGQYVEQYDPNEHYEEVQPVGAQSQQFAINNEEVVQMEQQQQEGVNEPEIVDEDPMEEVEDYNDD